MKQFLRFPDLVELDLVRNWTTLNNWIRDRGFPPGRMVGRCHMWTGKEVVAWIESQPTENPAPLRGVAKKARAQSEAQAGGVAS